MRITLSLLALLGLSRQTLIGTHSAEDLKALASNAKQVLLAEEQVDDMLAAKKTVEAEIEEHIDEETNEPIIMINIPDLFFDDGGEDGGIDYQNLNMDNLGGLIGEEEEEGDGDTQVDSIIEHSLDPNHKTGNPRNIESIRKSNGAKQ